MVAKGRMISKKNPRKMRKMPSSIVGICNMFFEFSFLLFFGFFMTNFPKKQEGFKLKHIIEMNVGKEKTRIEKRNRM